MVWLEMNGKRNLDGKRHTRTLMISTNWSTPESPGNNGCPSSNSAPTQPVQQKRNEAKVSKNWHQIITNTNLLNSRTHPDSKYQSPSNNPYSQKSTPEPYNTCYKYSSHLVPPAPMPWHSQNHTISIADSRDWPIDFAAWCLYDRSPRRGCERVRGRVGRGKVWRRGVGGGFWIFDDGARWSRRFRGRIPGLGWGRVRLVFRPDGLGVSNGAVWRWDEVIECRGVSIRSRQWQQNSRSVQVYEAQVNQKSALQDKYIQFISVPGCNNNNGNNRYTNNTPKINHWNSLTTWHNNYPGNQKICTTPAAENNNSTYPYKNTQNNQSNETNN